MQWIYLKKTSKNLTLLLNLTRKNLRRHPKQKNQLGIWITTTLVPEDSIQRELGLDCRKTKSITLGENEQRSLIRISTISINI